MKLERSDTWAGDGRSVWRVVSNTFHWGPYCYTRRNAWWEWMKGFKRQDEFGLTWMPVMLAAIVCIIAWEVTTIPTRRLWRKCWGRCLVCGRRVGIAYRYCSLECSAYDGALKEPKKSRILWGRIMPPKPHHEADMKGDL